jgi:hypothetical protein
MTKTIVSILLVVGTLLPVAAFADTVACGQVDPSTGIVRDCGNGSPEMVTNVWGGTNSDVPHILPGQSRVNKFGVSHSCPWWFSNYCVDISETAYYTSRWSQ